MNTRTIIAGIVGIASLQVSAQTLTVDASQVICPIEPLIYGAGAEDVNHEIYGGLYDQKIFGEGFEEPATTTIQDFTAYDEEWGVTSGMAQLVTSRHGKLIYEPQTISSGSVEVEVRMDNINAIAGLIVAVSAPGNGADAFNGYEIALNASKKSLVLGKHQQNWQPITDTQMSMNGLGEWNKLRVVTSGASITIYLNGKQVQKYTDTTSPLTSGKIGLRSYGGSATWRNLKVKGKSIPFVGEQACVSKMWTPVGDGQYDHASEQPFTGRYCQQISGKAGDGIANMGLNGWGISMQQGQRLNVSLYLRGTAPTAQVTLQSADGTQQYASTTINGITEEWRRFDTTITPDTTDPTGRFTLQLASEGSIWADQVLLATDSYPFRDDLTQAFRDEHLTFLRYGGTMVNAREYMTRNMIGSRLERQPYNGHWYLHATNGFAIPEFVEFARLIGTEPTFAINIEDNPTDVLAMLREIEPYHLRYIEIGNEENLTTDARSAYEHYVERYLILYNAIHAVYPQLQFIHSAWWRADKLETMEYVFRALDGRCDYWDFHPWTETPQQALNVEKDIQQMQECLLKWNPQTTMRCAILEENGNTHDMARALAHAVMLNNVRRSKGFVPLDSPANALQPYKQNDNGWDQGQIFFNPSQVWYQPPYYAQQMAATTHQPLLVQSKCTLSGLDYTATRNEAGDTLVLHIVNYSNSVRSLGLNISGFGEVSNIRTLSLSGTEKGENTPQQPTQFIPKEGTVKPGSRLILRAYSYTVVVLTSNDETDAISSPNAHSSQSNAQSSIYDLSGRQLAKEPMGIYIQERHKRMK